MPTAYRYLVRHPRESRTALAARRTALEDYCRARLSGLTCAPVEDSHKAYGLPFRQRPAGRDLDHRLTAGDVLVTTCRDTLRELQDWSQLLDRWSGRGVTVHCTDLPEPIEPGSQLAAEMQQFFAKLEYALTHWGEDD